MKHLTTIAWMTCSLLLFCSSCKKNKTKLENPFGLMMLGSDTTLPDGRYVIRTDYGCSGFANMLYCDNVDEILTMSGFQSQLYPVDHLQDIDTLALWYVKKVRYVSPDPDYALAFGYRIFQYRPGTNKYRFLSFSSTGSTVTWTDDELGDGGGKSVKAGVFQLEKYPRDPDIPDLATSNDTMAQVDTRYLFQFYKSPDNPNALILKSGGIRGSLSTDIVGRWKFATAYWDEPACDGNAVPPHFRSENSKCETVDDGNGSSRRCYIGEFIFQKAY